MGRRRSRIEKKKYLNPEVADASLVAHYKLWAGFEKPVVAGVSDGSVFDYSLNGNSGVIDKDNAVTVPAYPGFSFDGADSLITVAADPTIDANGKTALSIAAWINPASDGEDDAGKIVDKQSGGVGYSFHVNNEVAGSMAIRWVVENTTDMTATISPIVSINVWTNVAVTYDLNDGVRKGKVYINAVLVANSTTDIAGSAGALPDDSGVAMGVGNRTARDKTFHGTISDIRIWPNARSAIQIRNLYNQTRWRYSV